MREFEIETFLPATGFSKAQWGELSERRKQVTKREKRERRMMGTSTERERGKKVIANDWGRGGKRSISSGRVPSDRKSKLEPRNILF